MYVQGYVRPNGPNDLKLFLQVSYDAIKIKFFLKAPRHSKGIKKAFQAKNRCFRIGHHQSRI